MGGEAPLIAAVISITCQLVAVVACTQPWDCSSAISHLGSLTG
jgi:hypothetical protein